MVSSGLGTAGIVAIPIPAGGALGDVLTKQSADNYDFDWDPAAAAGPTVDPGTIDNTILRWNGATPAWEEFTSYILPLADGADGQAIITDGAGTLTFGTVSGGGALSGQYRFSTSTVAADPGPGRFRYDAVAYVAVTQIFIDDFTNQGVDISNILSLITTGDRLYIQAEGDSDEFAVWDVTAPATDNVGWFTIDVSLVASGDLLDNNDRTLFILQIGGALVTLQVAYDNLTAPPQITVNATPDPVTIDASVAGDIFAIRNLSNTDLLRLDDTRLTITDVPITHSQALSPAANNIVFSDTFVTGGVFIGGPILSNGTVGYDNSFFIWALLQESKRYEALVDPGFAAFTLFNALPLIANVGNFDLVQALVLNVGVTHARESSGTSTTTQTVGVSFAAQSRATVSGAVMTKTAGNTALAFSPTFSTVAGSTVNLGTQVGVRCNNPAQALFQPGAGAETMTAYFGLDVGPIPFGGNVTKAAVRSGITLASNARFLLNTGGADSDFGTGDLHFNDNAGIFFGNTVAASDMLLFWASASSSLTFSTFFGTGGAPMQLVGTAADEWIFQQDGGGTLDIGIQFDVNAVSFGTTLPTPNSNNWFTIFSAPSGRQVQIGGEYSDVLWTAGGFIDVNGMAVSDLQAFKINSPSIVLNGGTIADLSNLYVAAMPSFGGTRMQALRVLGRSRLDGLMTHNEETLTQLTADVAALALPPNNLGRFVLLQDADALGPWTIQGIVNVQVGDSVYFINNGANAWDFGHEDAAAAAADRIITPTAATWTLGAREFAKLWYDPVATRWRILESNGA